MSRKVLGLDIRHDAIAAVLVKSGIKGNWVESCMYVPLSDQNLFPPSDDGEEAENPLIVSPVLVSYTISALPIAFSLLLYALVNPISLTIRRIAGVVEKFTFFLA